MNTSTVNCGPDPIGSSASGVTINWTHNAKPGSVDRALFVFTEISTGKQTRHEVAPAFHTCIPLTAGLYRVAVIANGLEQYRGTLELRAGATTQLSPLLNPAKTTQKTLSEILKRLEINEAVDPQDLVVQKNTRVVLDSSNDDFSRDWKYSKIKDVATAKRVLGHSDELFPNGVPRFPPQPLSPQSRPVELATAAAREYIYGNSASVSQWTQEVNSALFNEVWTFPAFIWGTVTINAGGVLVIGSNANFFICQRLRMHVASTLLIRGVGPVLVEPLAFETFC